MKNYTDKELKQELSRRGYYTDNLWHVDDVMSEFICGKDEAQEVLDESLCNDATYDQIWSAIKLVAEGKNLIKQNETN